MELHAAAAATILFGLRRSDYAG